MRRFVWALIVAATVLATSIGAQAPAPDWGSCHDELDRTRRAASDASGAAEEAESKLSNIRSKRDEYQECRDYPNIYDFMHDGCRSRRSDYESALGDYESARGDFESKMEDLDNRLRSVQSYCEYDFTLNRMSSSEAASRGLAAAEQRLCSSYKRFVILGVTPQSVLEMCKKNRTEQWCKTCLGIK